MNSRNNKNRHTIAIGLSPSFAIILLVFVDLFALTSATGLITSAIAIPHINPPPRDVGKRRTPIEPTALYFEVRWPDGELHDIDVWVACYNEIGGIKVNFLSIGFIQKSNLWMDLIRDDLGRPSVINFERVLSNSEAPTIPPNAFCRFNVHLYHSHGGSLPVEGVITAIANKDDTANERLIASIPFVLSVRGEEITVLTVAWDDRGVFIPQSVKTFPEVETKLIATGRIRRPDA